MRHAILIALFVLYGVGIIANLVALGSKKPARPISRAAVGITLVLQVAIIAVLTVLW